MKVLGFETSCDDTSVAIVEDGRKVLSCVVSSQVSEHSLYGGVVPEIASRRHCESIKEISIQTFKKTPDLSLDDIDVLASTYAPGLVGSLLVGLNFAKGICLSKKIPLVPVHHLKGHIASLYLSNKDLVPPFLCMIVSGGHTQIVNVCDYTDIKTVAKTRDDAAGEAFDKIARCLGLPYPGGVFIDKIASEGNPESYKDIPRPKLDSSKYDFSFSGIKTYVINMISNAKNRGEKINVNDMAASVRFAICDYMVSRFMMIAMELKARKIAICGGVSANSLLRNMVKEECERNNIEFFLPELQFCGDNAAMVASQGYYEYMAGNIAELNINAMSSKEI